MEVYKKNNMEDIKLYFMVLLDLRDYNSNPRICACVSVANVIEASGHVF